MSRSSDFDRLFDRLEASIATLRAVQLKTVTDQLLVPVLNNERRCLDGVRQRMIDGQ